MKTKVAFGQLFYFEDNETVLKERLLNTLRVILLLLHQKLQ
jgi:hypothetical protein